MRSRIKLAFIITAVAAFAGMLTSVLVWWPEALAAEVVAAHLGEEAWKGGLLAAALATGLSSLGAGYAVAMVGSAAVGALAEKPELFGRLIILVGLAEGIAIYGVIISILITDRLS